MELTAHCAPLNTPGQPGSWGSHRRSTPAALDALFMVPSPDTGGRDASTVVLCHMLRAPQPTWQQGRTACYSYCSGTRCEFGSLFMQRKPSLGNALSPGNPDPAFSRFLPPVSSVLLAPGPICCISFPVTSSCSPYFPEGPTPAP